MRHMTVKIVLLLILFALVGGAIFYIMQSPGEREAASYVPGFSIREENQGNQEPIPVSNTPVVTIPPTPVPTAAPEPTAPPEPTPTPYVPTPEPVKTPLGSGSISSTRPWLLNIHADWSAVTAAAGNARVEVVVYADHYPISYNSFESLIIRLGEDSQRMYANEIHSDRNQLQSTELGRYTYTISLAPGETKTLPLSAVWEFNGYYGDGFGNSVEIPSLRCEGTITLSR